MPNEENAGMGFHFPPMAAEAWNELSMWVCSVNLNGMEPGKNTLPYPTPIPLAWVNVCSALPPVSLCCRFSMIYTSSYKHGTLPTASPR